MPYYKFVAQDREGRKRNGRLASATVEEARQRLESAGLVILQLSEHKEPTLVAGASQPGGFRAERAQPLDVTSRPLYQQGIEFFEFASTPRRLQPALIALAMVGLVWSIITAITHRPKPESRVLPAPTPVPLVLDVTGSVQTEGDKEPADIIVTLELPELDYQLQRSWRELGHPQPDTFNLKLETKTTREPTHFVLRARKQGYLEARSQPLPWSRGAVRIPPLTLRKDNHPQPSLTPIARPHINNVPARAPLPSKPLPSR